MKARLNSEERPLASQTLLRGLNVIDAVAAGYTTLPEISAHTGLNSSTAHRLASALVQVRYLKFEARRGYSLGNKLLELGFMAYRQADIPARARRYLENLSELTKDTVHLAVLEENEVVYLDKLPGQRPVEISSRIGGRKAVCTTGVGKALLLDSDESIWRAQYHHDKPSMSDVLSETQWLRLMKQYATVGYALDLGEDHAMIRCVAAPIYDGSGRIVAAISVSSAAEYMTDDRINDVIADVLKTAKGISHELGAAASRSVKLANARKA